MKRFAVLLFFFLSPGFFLRAQTGPISSEESDRLLFLEGVNLSYNDQYRAADTKLREYLKAHPNDHLAASRLLYNRFFELRNIARKGREDERKLTKEEYDGFLREMNGVIEEYERIACRDVDFGEVSGDTLDCPYVGGALYSLRMAFFGDNDPWYKLVGKLGKDNTKFWRCINASKSLQASFLAGVYEYKVSKQWRARKAAEYTHNPANFDHAVKKIEEGLDDSMILFGDDVRFFILRIEREQSMVEDRCELNRPQRDPTVQELFRIYPPMRVAGYLRSKYPQNTDVQDFFRFCGGGREATGNR